MAVHLSLIGQLFNIAAFLQDARPNNKQNSHKNCRFWEEL
jgi:hypothetical protein